MTETPFTLVPDVMPEPAKKKAGRPRKEIPAGVLQLKAALSALRLDDPSSAQAIPCPGTGGRLVKHVYDGVGPERRLVTPRNEDLHLINDYLEKAVALLNADLSAAGQPLISVRREIDVLDAPWEVNGNTIPAGNLKFRFRKVTRPERPGKAAEEAAPAVPAAVVEVPAGQLAFSG